MKSSQIHQVNDSIGDNRYKIIRFIGEGGMQQVYEAQDLVLEKSVALKVPKNSSALKRFRRSAVVSAQINHPNVAKTLDYLEDGEISYLIEELIDGDNLNDGFLGKVKFVDPYLAAKVFHYLAKGVAASHHVGVFHRDLKPDNIMIVGGFNLDQIKITDFGIAKLAEAEFTSVLGNENDTLASSTAVGAIPYMAPEMFLDAKSAGLPADIWALGAMMYELISGKKPFGSGHIAIAKILDQINPGAIKPEQPSQIVQNSQVKPLGDALYQIILSCMNSDVDSRVTADELVTKCEKLSYPIAPRQMGTVTAKHPQYNWGNISTDFGGKFFFHFDSVFGEAPIVGSRVCFSAFSGQPLDRAHPVIVLRN